MTNASSIAEFDALNVPTARQSFEVKTSKSKSTSGRIDLEKSALQFAFLSQGGIDKAIRAVENFKMDDVAAFIQLCGSPTHAKHELEKLKEKKA